MSAVQTITVGPEEADIRPDRWFRRHFPELGHGRLEKLLRTGQVRVDGGRVKAAHRMQPGQVVRIPPLGDGAGEVSKARPQAVDPSDAAALQSWVLYKDKDLIALNKPPGLA